MATQDVFFIIRWWFTLFTIGIIFLPFTSLIFQNFYDKGYIFSKTIGIAVISYTVFVLGILKIVPFTIFTILFVIATFLFINLLTATKVRPSLRSDLLTSLKLIIFEECIFLGGLLFWSYIKSHEPSIHGLEKFMDFGFINSILRSTYFPPVDMWFSPQPINYYYFGHLTTALLTKLSGIQPQVTFNLMLASLFAFTFTGAFSLSSSLFYTFLSRNTNDKGRIAKGTSLGEKKRFRSTFICGMFAGFLMAFAGNLHTLYAFFKPYSVDAPQPFWNLPFSFSAFPNSYWYANATRFIYNTIHEFPIYSFVVSDLHGHVLDIPFVLLTIALLFSLISKSEARNPKQIQNHNVQMSKLLNRISNLLLLSFLLAVMYMTNAWDGIIYFLLAFLILFMRERGFYVIISTVILFVGFALFSLPFSLYFKPFASRIGVICAPDFLIQLAKLGPFLFESNHCLRSPWWQLLTLYGFFFFFVGLFFIFLLTQLRKRETLWRFQIGRWTYSTLLPAGELHPFAWLDKKAFRHASDIFVFILCILSLFLIALPEMIYVKDIYPAHYRANTMFKLVYQAFIMLSLASAYIIVRLLLHLKSHFSRFAPFALLFFMSTVLLLTLVGIYPYFAVSSYFGKLQNYSGLDGLSYLRQSRPFDHEAILWINRHIKGQSILLEAQGDSYTDYGRISANTGLPTVLGWTVHEWLWRGSYEISAPRIEEVRNIYEAPDYPLTISLLKKHNVSYVYIGGLEREKYPNINEEKFGKIGKIVYQNRNVQIYKIKD